MGPGSDMYRQQILDHYKNPRNYGELEGADIEHVGETPSAATPSRCSSSWRTTRTR